MFAIRGQNWCGCGAKLKTGPDRICRRCDLPYGVLDVKMKYKMLEEQKEPKPNLCGEIPLGKL